MIANLIRAYKRGRTAFLCAKRIHEHLVASVNYWAARPTEEPSEEAKKRLEFWARQGIRYHRIAMGKSPWSDKQFVQD